ncbi:conserved exported hypothetical protein [Actinacidiphila cocklensis]|jgi:hypothetical protein|uniref:Lipoprotein n=2 Tax=Actinacidiphila cocklensis TaxID=887465 RepID=A0A9W4E437_9ACTN|nr:conserved exported hypothetical protein [Actinacidiphila cocklensis]
MVAAMSTGATPPAVGTPAAGRLRRAATAAAAAGCAVALVTGCVQHGAAAGGEPAAAEARPGGAKDAGGDASAAVWDAADALVRAGSSLVETSMRMASGGTWVTVTGTGRFDYARRQGELILVLPRDAAGAEEHRPVTEVMTPGALYMKDRGAGVPAGKWVRVDTTALPDGNLVTGGATEPLAAAELLRGAQQVVLVGEEALGGTPVRHYRGVADIARAARAAAPGTSGALTAAAGGFAVTRVPFDAWLDAEGRLRRLTEHFTFGAKGSGVGVVSTTVFDGFGALVAFATPRGDDIWAGKIVSS